LDTLKIPMMVIGKVAYIWLNIADNQNCSISFSKSLPFRFSATSAKRFGEYTDKFIYGLVQTGLYYE
jgi:hypothetical protein